jgi:hypothetical protein
VRAAILKHDYAGAIATSNNLDTADLAEEFDSLRHEFWDVDFGSDFRNEVYYAALVNDKSGPMEAVLETFPTVRKYKALLGVTEALNNKANVTYASYLPPSAPRTPILIPNGPPGMITDLGVQSFITARNPLYILIHGLNLSDTAAQQTPGLGQVYAGRIDNDTRFTPDTMFDIRMTTSESNRYILLRRLRRAGMCYVVGFDIYLTYFTDLCRIVESMLPEYAKQAVQPLAEYNFNHRFARTGAIKDLKSAI